VPDASNGWPRRAGLQAVDREERSKTQAAMTMRMTTSYRSMILATVADLKNPLAGRPRMRARIDCSLSLRCGV
jgi:hypothetical protein